VNGRYVASPFGSFENFKKVVKGDRLKFYDPYLSGKKLFHLRTKKSIHASEIEKIIDEI
jgi:hypothetical protein